MRNVAIGKTGMTVPQNGFGALPIQRDSVETAVGLLRKAYEGGMRYFDTARAYTDSEEKVGIAFEDQSIRRNLYIATKTAAKNGEDLKRDLETSLRLLKTDYIDLYQLHQIPQVFKPGDGSGLYEALSQAKEQGLVRHIGVTAHKLGVAEEAVESGLYETLQYPFSYLASDREIRLAKRCRELGIGFICMKGLAGGLITRSDAAMAFMTQFDHVVPIWGIQRDHELDEWLSYMDNTPEMTEEIRAYIEGEKKELAGDFCRGCGYCMPCPADIPINDANRITQLLQRSPWKSWVTPEWQKQMERIEDCIHCGECAKKCPYGLKPYETLPGHLAFYREFVRTHHA